MADKKISALTASTTPLAGTEVLPIVQGGATVKVSVASLTAGRSPSMNYAIANNGLILQNGGVNRWFLEREAGAGDDFYIYRYNDAGGYAGNPLLISRSNGNVSIENNLVIRTSGNGIDFSATPGTGTSELLADYEEGTWTPLISANGAGVTNFTSTAAIGRYTKVGRLVTIYCRYTYTNIGSVGNDFAFMSGLPFASLNTGMEVTGSMQVGQSSFLARIFQPKMENNGSRILFQFDNGTGALYAGAPYMVGNSFPSSGDITILLSYFTA